MHRWEQPKKHKLETYTKPGSRGVPLMCYSRMSVNVLKLNTGHLGIAADFHCMECSFCLILLHSTPAAIILFSGLNPY